MSGTPISTGTANAFQHSLKNGKNGHLAELDASLLTTKCTNLPRNVPEPESAEYKSQKVCTDHMITVSWTQQHGWHRPELKPYGPFQIMPTSSVLHYATECFEGLKLYRGKDGNLRLFRPELNCKRMLRSAKRIALPSFPPDELLKLITKLCAIDGPRWLPKSRPGSFLYLRPAMIADDPALGVAKPQQAMLFIILVCFPSLDFSTASIPGMKLFASEKNMIRAWPGGFGFAKLGANYGPTLAAQAEAREKGYDQILWLLGDDGAVTEAGASNFFVIWKTREDQNQLITAPLEDNIILDGVTRRSIIDLASTRLFKPEGDLDKLEVVERKFYLSEIAEAAHEGRLIEAFAAGTAFFIAPISRINYQGSDIEVPRVGGNCGIYASAFKTWLNNIKYGEEPHTWGYEIDESAVDE